MRALTSAAAAAVFVAIVPSAHAACEVPLPGDTAEPDELSCGALNPPPENPGGTAGAPAKLILWSSGYDVNPFNGKRGGIWVSRLDGSGRHGRRGTGNGSSAGSLIRRQRTPETARPVPSGAGLAAGNRNPGRPATTRRGGRAPGRSTER